MQLIAVSPGNFGISWQALAKQMGLPVEELVCASIKGDDSWNSLETGHYNKKRGIYLQELIISL